MTPGQYGLLTGMGIVQRSRRSSAQGTSRPENPITTSKPPPRGDRLLAAERKRMRIRTLSVRRIVLRTNFQMTDHR